MPFALGGKGLKSCRIVNQVTTTVVSQMNKEIPKVGKSCLTYARDVQLTTALTQHLLATYMYLAFKFKTSDKQCWSSFLRNYTLPSSTFLIKTVSMD